MHSDELFRKLLSAAWLGVSLFVLDLGVHAHLRGGSVWWAVFGGILVVAASYEAVRRFRPPR